MAAPVKVVGRYAIYEEFASGGMATVHLARMTGPGGFGRTVAVKRMHPQFAKDPSFVAMFLDEARLVSRIHHPNVVKTLDVVAEEGELFLVMEYVNGDSMAFLLKAAQDATTRLSPPVVCNVIGQALRGLHAAHEAKSEHAELLELVHRDVSPQNILVGIDGSVGVVDFGVAKAAGRLQTTQGGELKGKLGYMAPEQITGNKVDRRADVFAAGVVLWEALTTKRLFGGETHAETIGRVLFEDPRPPSSEADDIPPALDEVVLRSLKREKDERFQTAAEMADAIERAVPLVSLAKVAGVVDSLAGTRARKRASFVAEVERSSRVVVIGQGRPDSTDPAGIARPPPGGADESTITEVVQTGPKPRRLAVMGVGAILFGAGIMYLLLSNNWGGGTDASATTSTTSPSLPVEDASPAAEASVATTASIDHPDAALTAEVVVPDAAKTPPGKNPRFVPTATKTTPTSPNTPTVTVTPPPTTAPTPKPTRTSKPPPESIYGID